MHPSPSPQPDSNLAEHAEHAQRVEPAEAIDEAVDDEGSEPRSATRSAGRAGTRRRSTKGSVQRWARILHAYSSMVCLLMVLFFSVTGLTLNHPNWTLGGHTSRETVQGVLPTAAVQGTSVDWLAVAEYLRATHSLRGTVSDHQVTGTDASITFKGPGYLANADFPLDTRAYTLEVESQGYVGVLNDLHKGRDTRTSWKWLIDGSAILLVFISLTGLILQLVLRARRRSAIWSAIGGSVALIALIYVAIR